MKQQQNGITLLLVDDDHRVLASMADWLGLQGYQLDTASNRTAAIAAIDRRTYDLILTDIRLADGDGFDILAYARQKTPSTAVIMITGYGMVESAVEAIRAGAFDFLTKPLIDQELEMAIERALNQQRILVENKCLKAQLDLRFGLENIVGSDQRMPLPLDLETSPTLKQALSSPERQIILNMLEANHWNRHDTAEALGINRTTLYKKMKRLNLEEPRHAIMR